MPVLVRMLSNSTRAVQMSAAPALAASANDSPPNQAAIAAAGSSPSWLSPANGRTLVATVNMGLLVRLLGSASEDVQYCAARFVALLTN